MYIFIFPKSRLKFIINELFFQIKFKKIKYSVSSNFYKNNVVYMNKTISV